MTALIVIESAIGLPGKMGQVVVQFDPKRSSYSFHGDAEEAA